MTFEIAFVIILLAGILITFVIDRVAPDVIAFATIALLMISGILTPEEAISGFSNPATITILALFFVSQALANTGFIRMMGGQLLKVSGKGLPGIVLLLMLVTATTSAFINTTAVVIVFLPMVMRLAKARKVSPTVLLMPLSFGAIIGGASTTIGTSTNLLISDIASSHGLEVFNIFEFTHIGLVLMAVIIGYMIFASYYILKARKGADNLIADYNLKNYFTEVTLEPSSKWVGKRLDEIDDISVLEIDIIEIVRKEDSIVDYNIHELLHAGDTLLVRVNANNLIQLKELPGMNVASMKTWRDKDFTNLGITLMEVMVNSNSSVIGKTIPELNFKQNYNSTIIGVIGGHNRFLPKRMKEMRLRFGDTLLIQTVEENKHVFYENHDFIVLQELKAPQFQKEKSWIAIAVVLGIIGLAASGILPILVAAITGAAILFATGCVNINQAYQSVEWSIIFLLAGLIPMGLALEKTGASDLLAQWLSGMVDGLPVYWALFALYMATTLMTSIIYNNATAIIVVPIMIALAPTLNVEPEALMALTMFAANCCFLTPIGYQTNLLIYAPGQYKFRDFVLIGGPLCILLGLLCSYLVMAWI